MKSAQIEILETRTLMSAAPAAHARPVAAPLIHATALKVVNPVTTSKAITYKNFAGDPLFASSGPTINDVNQGDLGDCYLLSTVSSVVKSDPALIRKDFAADGNGIYTITLGSGTSTRKINVNSYLPVWPDGQLAYARLGNEDSLWVALLEKAYVQFASPATNRYASISGGWMTSAFAVLGLKSQSTFSACKRRRTAENNQERS